MSTEVWMIYHGRLKGGRRELSIQRAKRFTDKKAVYGRAMNQPDGFVLRRNIIGLFDTFEQADTARMLCRQAYSDAVLSCKSGSIAALNALQSAPGWRQLNPDDYKDAPVYRFTLRERVQRDLRSAMKSSKVAIDFMEEALDASHVDQYDAATLVSAALQIEHARNSLDKVLRLENYG